VGINKATIVQNVCFSFKFSELFTFYKCSSTVQNEYNRVNNLSKQFCAEFIRLDPDIRYPDPVPDPPDETPNYPDPDPVGKNTSRTPLLVFAPCFD